MILAGYGQGGGRERGGEREDGRAREEGLGWKKGGWAMEKGGEKDGRKGAEWESRGDGRDQG